MGKKKKEPCRIACDLKMVKIQNLEILLGKHVKQVAALTADNIKYRKRAKDAEARVAELEEFILDNCPTSMVLCDCEKHYRKPSDKACLVCQITEREADIAKLKAEKQVYADDNAELRVCYAEMNARIAELGAELTTAKKCNNCMTKQLTEPLSCNGSEDGTCDQDWRDKSELAQLERKENA